MVRDTPDTAQFPSEVFLTKVRTWLLKVRTLFTSTLRMVRDDCRSSVLPSNRTV